MKSPSTKSETLNQALESALRESVPASEFPRGLHSSIMRAVRTSVRAEPTQLSGILFFQRLVQIRWLPLTGFTALVIFGVWLEIRHRPAQDSSTGQSLADISTAFTTSQEMVDAIPTVTIGPLSEELNKVNQDLSRTTDFLLAALP